MWRPDNAPVQGKRFYDYMSIALMMGRLSGGEEARIKNSTQNSPKLYPKLAKILKNSHRSPRNCYFSHQNSPKLPPDATIVAPLFFCPYLCTSIQQRASTLKKTGQIPQKKSYNQHSFKKQKTRNIMREYVHLQQLSSLQRRGTEAQRL